jgi:hypothetical protein
LIGRRWIGETRGEAPEKASAAAPKSPRVRRPDHLPNRFSGGRTTPHFRTDGRTDSRGYLIERYCAHQAGLMDHLRSLPTAIDPSQTIITSPLLGFVTYSLDDCFTILVVHGQRHADQARRVTETEGFPV